ncbi:hypothetical protein NLJ89_g10530 [Agrocybe chaxingu]|uniref:Uncharacterized protein n=1 Tax=Agrocybe chaxingu TaxID=84603 RepID=A0A9W8JQZ3_9AGAR|nr:hypothetical protein NLJ89_g10530 [Agrocybe chaxingu]
MINTFPQELFDRFVDELVPPDAGSVSRSIRACLFVSPLRHRALSLIFKKITVYLNHPSETRQRLTNLLRIIPPRSRTSLNGIRPYIKEIAFKFDFKGTQAAARDCLQVILSCREFADLIKALQGKDYGVRGLAFDIQTPFASYHPGPEVVKALLPIITSPFLRSLKLTNVTEVPVTFLAGAHVDELLLKRVQFQESSRLGGRRLTAVARWPQIRSLTCDAPLSKVLLNPTSTSPFRNLERFERACKGPEQVSEAWKIIFMAADTLRDITIEGDDELLHCDGKRAYISRAPNLTSLHLTYPPRLRFDVELNTGRESVAFFTAMLAVPAPMSKLEKLTLTGHLSGGPDAPGISLGGTDNILLAEAKPEWEALDNLLTGPKYPSLKVLKLRFSFDVFVINRLLALEQLGVGVECPYAWTADGDREAFVEMIASHLPALLPQIDSSPRIQFLVEIVDS